jgi:hypothetical protein
MSYMMRKLSEDWSSIRMHGRLQFIVVYGVIAWGLATAAISTALFAYFAPQLSAREFALFAFSIFPLLGILLGSNVWARIEQYHQA